MEDDFHFLKLSVNEMKRIISFSVKEDFENFVLINVCVTRLI